MGIIFCYEWVLQLYSKSHTVDLRNISIVSESVSNNHVFIMCVFIVRIGTRCIFLIVFIVDFKQHSCVISICTFCVEYNCLFFLPLGKGYKSNGMNEIPLMLVFWILMLLYDLEKNNLDAYKNNKQGAVYC